MKRLYQYEGRLTTRNPNASAVSAPVLPYNGSSGWSGTDSSKERADRDDAFGSTKKRQEYILNLLKSRGEEGATWKEVSALSMMHHGQSSGALSVLHKDGEIARLTEKRDRCRVYVLPEYVHGRETDTQGRKHTCPECGHTF